MARRGRAGAASGRRWSVWLEVFAFDSGAGEAAAPSQRFGFRRIQPEGARCKARRPLERALRSVGSGDKASGYVSHLRPPFVSLPSCFREGGFRVSTYQSAFGAEGQGPRRICSSDPSCLKSEMNTRPKGLLKRFRTKKTDTDMGV
jgi:hypothetical protein